MQQAKVLIPGLGADVLRENGSYCGSTNQPIMQLKELRVDEVRYREWKCMILRSRPHPKSSTPSS